MVGKKSDSGRILGNNTISGIVDTSEVAEYLKLKGVKEESLKKQKNGLILLKL